MFRTFFLLTYFAIMTGCVDAAPACTVFPSNNVWNTKINTLPAHEFSDQWLVNMGKNTGLHADFGSGTWEGKKIGIPFNVLKKVSYWNNFVYLYEGESDQFKYPVNPDLIVEEGSDKHLISIDMDTCKLYELFNTNLTALTADSGAIFNLKSNEMRTNGWTSADAAGLPIFPGLIRYSEVASGKINHAIRFVVSKTHGSTWPATHMTSGELGKAYSFRPPMGARLRLKSDFAIVKYPKEIQVILQALKDYGMILADNGSDVYLSGSPDERWNNDILSVIGEIKMINFEAVDSSCMIVDQNSYQASLAKCGKPLIIAKSTGKPPQGFIDELMALIAKWNVK